MEKRYANQSLRPHAPVSNWDEHHQSFTGHLTASPDSRDSTSTEPPSIEFALPGDSTITSLYAQAMLTGYLYVDTQARRLTFHVSDFGSRLKDEGQNTTSAEFTNFADLPFNCGGVGHRTFHEFDAKLPWPLFEDYQQLAEQPQLMPLPARIYYELNSTYTDFAQKVSQTLTAYLYVVALGRNFDDIFALLNDSEDNEVPPWDALKLTDELQDLEAEGYFRPNPHSEGTHGLTSDTSSIFALVQQIINEPMGLRIEAGRPVVPLPPGSTLSIRAEDYRNYGLFDQPLAIFRGSIDVESQDDVAILPPSTYSPTDGLQIEPSQLQSLRDDTTTEQESEQVDGETEYVVLASNDSTAALANYDTVFLHYTDGNADQFVRLEHDKPQLKYSLHATDLRWHFRNWLTAGFSNPDPLNGLSGFYRAFFVQTSNPLTGTQYTLNQTQYDDYDRSNPRLYPEMRPAGEQLAHIQDNAAPNAGIRPPIPTLGGFLDGDQITDAFNQNTYAQGENYGKRRPFLDFDPEKLRFSPLWHLDDNTNSRDPADFSDGGVGLEQIYRNLIDGQIQRPRYLGARGLEEYAKFTAAHEIGLNEPINQNWPEDFHRWAPANDAFLVAAKSYLLFRWFQEQEALEPGELKHPVKTNYGASYQNENHTPVEERSGYETIDSSTGFQVHSYKLFAYLFQADQNFEVARRRVEEGVARNWGQIMMYKGRFVELEYYAGDPTETRGVQGDQSRPWKQQVLTSYGIDPQNPGGAGHGRAMSQNGAKDLAERRLSHLQILHWYNYGVTVRNEFGMGDFVSSAPDLQQDPDNPGDFNTYDWLVGTTADPTIPDLPDDAVFVSYNQQSEEVLDHWTQRSEFQQGQQLALIQSNDTRDWHIAYNFRASEVSQDLNAQGNNANIAVQIHRLLLRRLQKLRYRLDAQVQVDGLVEEDGNLTGNRIRIDLSGIQAQANVIQNAINTIFGADRNDALGNSVWDVWVN